MYLIVAICFSLVIRSEMRPIAQAHDAELNYAAAHFKSLIACELRVMPPTRLRM